MEIHVDVKSKTAVSAYTDAHFDDGAYLLRKLGMEVISLQENAELRIEAGLESFVSLNRNWVREGVLYIPDKGTFLTRNSPIVANPREAVKIFKHRKKGGEVYLTDEQTEQALEDSVKLSAGYIPTDRLAEIEVGVYAFGKLAQDYGMFLKESGADNLHVILAKLKEKPFVRQAFLGWVPGGSAINGKDGDFFRVRVRGFRRINALREI